ncbi:MAG TPA: cadherin-like beta sandwich domain-containing protein [Ruminiclostridium sp.]|nr:cadherin-like beta sandwich domain-containing protein [Ruminiclostridium sp.]
MGNTALIGQVSASSYIAPFQAARAVDGINKPVNRWVGEVPCVLNFTPDTLYCVNRWVVSGMASTGWDPQQYYLLTYSLEGSNDNKIWFTLDTVDNTNTSTITFSSDRTFIPTAAYRYYRVNVKKGLKCNPNIASISNFQLYPVNPTSQYLSGLSISNGTLDPAFNKYTFAYNATVDYSTASIVVTPVAEVPTAYGQNAVIRVNGVPSVSGTGVPVNLLVGTNTVTIDVTSAVGYLSQRYTLTVVRQNSNKLSNLQVLNGTTVLPMTPSPYNKNTYAYSVEVDSTVQSVMINATCENPSSTMTINGSPATSGQPFGPIPLGVGDTVANIVVSTSGMSPQTYSVTIKRSEDLTLANLVVTNGKSQVALQYNSTNSEYTGSTSKASVLSVIPTASSPANVTISVNGTNVASGGTAVVPVTAGIVNTIPIVVKSNSSGNTKSYTCAINVSK